jgi:HEAT repeat protein
VRLTGDSDSSAADLDFFNSITQSLDDSHAEHDSESEMEFASSGSQAFMSLSGMLAAPEIPRQRYAQAPRSPQNSSAQSYPSAGQNNAMQTPWYSYQTQTPNSAFDMATITGNTPAYSTPMMPGGGMPTNGLYPPGMPANMMQPGMMQPGTVPVVPAFDMTTSSPLIPAFTNVTTHPAAAAAIVSSQSSPSGVSSPAQLSPQPVAVAKIALPANDEPAVDEIALEKARAAQAHERALVRLRKAREEAFRTLLADSQDIPKTMPRLLKKRISTLMSTPSIKLDQTVEQIFALGTTNSPAALATLSSFCQKPAKQIREACAKAMGEIVHSGSAVLLMKLLADKSGTVVEAAIKSLTKLDLAPTRPVLLAAGLCGTNLRTVVTVGVESAADEKKTEWEKLLLEKLREDDTESAAFAVSLLSRFVGDTHLEIFQKLASHEAPVLRAAAVDALARTQAKRAISQINSALEDTDSSVRAQAATSVATMYSPRSVELLQKLVFDSNLTVRRNAAQTMSRIDEPDLAETIAKALDHESDATTVEYLLAALQRNGAQTSLSILQRYIVGESSQFREQALKALRKLKIPASIPIFKRLLDDRTPAIRRQSIEQLAVLKSEGILPRLREMLKQDPDETVRASCAKAIGDFSDDTSVHLLEEALEDHALVRLQAVISLGRLGQSSAGPILLSLMRDQMPEVRYQAVRAIAQLKLEGVEEQIAPLLEDSDEMVRRGAEQSLKDLGQSIGTIRSKRLRKRFVKVASMLTPSSVAGVIPGGAKSLLAVIVAIMLVGGYWGFSKMSFVMAGGEKLPVGRVVSVGISGTTKSVSVLRTKGVLDVWSVSEGDLTARVRVPISTEGVISEEEGGTILLMGTEIGRLDPRSEFDAEKMLSLKLTKRPSSVFYHHPSNSVCIFEVTGATTVLKVVDAATVKETKTFTIKAAFNGIVSPDFSLAAMLDSKGVLTLCELESGNVFTASVTQLTGQNDLGFVVSIGFTDDMKYVGFCTTTNFLALDVENMQLIKNIPTPDLNGFVAAQGVPGTSDFHVLAGSGTVYSLSNELQTLKETQIQLTTPFTMSAMAYGGDLVAMANQDFYGFDVYSIKEQQILLTNSGEE